MSNLKKDEKDLLRSYNKDEWKSSKNFKTEKRRFEEVAHNTIEKNRDIKIQILEKDFKELQLEALKDGIPHQALISIILHKYINGKLVEK
jgi:predicted DNA binding CopG/RHH family protein